MTTGRLRSLLLALVLVGIVGTVVDLLLLGHVEGGPELSPFVLLAASLLVVVWHLAAPSSASVRAVQLAMLLCVALGIIGIGYHYGSNEEAERERNPAITGGLILLRESLDGDTPLLAPGSLTMLGLVGLIGTYRHPLSRDAGGRDAS